MSSLKTAFFPLLLLSLSLPAGRAWAGQYNAVLDIGDEAPAWKDLENADGGQHSWSDVADAQCVVVAFTCNSCPYARDVEDRLIELTKEFPESKVRLVAINVNLINADRPAEMRRRAKDRGFTFPYLHDPTQQIAKDFGAIKTPEFFVLEGNRKVVYMGALDDSPDGSKVQQRYVADAVRAVLEGSRPETSETVPIGCRIRYSRERR